MAVGTPIGWCGIPGHEEATLNLVEGCRFRSAGCGLPRWVEDNTGACYAMSDVARQQHLPGRAGLTVLGEYGLEWTGKVAYLPERLRDPYGWTKPHGVFVNALGELFDPQVPDAFRAAAWVMMWYTSRAGRTATCGFTRRRTRAVHTYIILTKLADQMHRWMTKWCDPGQRAGLIHQAIMEGWAPVEAYEHAMQMPDALDNLWLGVSVEWQDSTWRLDKLADVPAAVRVASCEPLIGPLNVEPWLAAGTLDWVIAGGESERRKNTARPMHPDWIASLIDQTTEHQVPFFFKQWGQFGPDRPTGPALAAKTRYLVRPRDGRFERVADHPHSGAARAALGDEPGLADMYSLGKATTGEHVAGALLQQFPLRKAGLEVPA